MNKDKLNPAQYNDLIGDILKKTYSRGRYGQS